MPAKFPPYQSQLLRMWAEQPAHPTARHQHDRGGVGRAVPEDREKPPQRVDLEVPEVRSHLDLFRSQRLEELQR